MTLERDLDRRLAAWLDERSVAAPPADLLDRSLARVGATGQRAAWHFPGTTLRTRGRVSRSFVPVWALLLLAALLAIAVVIAGSQLLRTHATVIASLEPSAGPSTTAVETPMQTPVPTEAPGIAAVPGMFDSMRDLFAESDTVAWITTEGAVYRTGDAGLTWRAAQPPGWTLQGATVVVDDETAYYSPGGRQAAILVTHDGGQSWATTVVDAGADVGPPVFSFQSASMGHTTFVDPGRFDAKAGTGLIVFATADGGSTWTGPVRGTQPHMDASLNKLYAANGPFLLQNAGKLDSRPFENWFYLSSDGGVSYSKYTYPVSKISPKNAMKGVGDILQEPNGRLLIQFSASPAGPGTYPNAIYESTDDPAAWRLLYTEPGGDGNVQFLSAATWILPSGAPSEVRTTTDAGASWRVVNPSMSLYWAGDKVFTSLRTGWTTIECRWLPPGPDCGANPHAVHLFVTRDGGATWTDAGGAS